MQEALRRHWPEYLIEAGGLGFFMFGASVAATLLYYPAAPLARAVADPWLRRAVMGLAMGAIVVLIVYSPWGKRSGAHINPAFTLAFFRLGRVAPWDATFYIGAHFAGAVLGMVLAVWTLGSPLAYPAVDYVVTRPGAAGMAAAFVAELVISGVLMLVVLESAASPRFQHLTGMLVAGLLALYILLESPLSGTSMNPARSVGSALVAQDWTAIWIYFVAPVGGMVGAAEAFARWRARGRAPCAKLRHLAELPCIFCEHAERRAVLAVARAATLLEAE